MTSRVAVGIAGGGAVGLAIAVVLILLLSRCLPSLAGTAARQSPSPSSSNGTLSSPFPDLSPLPSDQPSPSPSPSLSPSPAPQLMIVDASMPPGDQNFTYAPKQFVATGGTQPYAWSISSGTLPPGLTLSSGGVVSGTPSSTGTYPFTVNVADAGGQGTSITTAVTVARPLVVTGSCTATPCQVEQGCIDVCGTYGTLQGGSPPYQYSLVSGTLPPSTQLNGLSLSGQFTTVTDPKRPPSFTVLVTDAAGMTGGTAASFAVLAHETLAPASLPQGARGKSYSARISYVTPFPTPTVKVTSGALPPGLTANVAGGSVVIGGTISRSARTTTYNFTLTLTDQALCGPGAGDHCVASNDYTIVVN